MFDRLSYGETAVNFLYLAALLDLGTGIGIAYYFHRLLGIEGTIAVIIASFISYIGVWVVASIANNIIQIRKTLERIERVANSMSKPII